MRILRVFCWFYSTWSRHLRLRIRIRGRCASFLSTQTSNNLKLLRRGGAEPELIEAYDSHSALLLKAIPDEARAGPCNFTLSL